MIVTMHGQHFALTPSLRRFAVENLQKPLEAVWDRAGTQLDICLRGLSGAQKEGVGKECRCVLYLPHGPKFVITEIDADMRTSIFRSRKRLLRRVREFAGRTIEQRRHERKRNPAWKTKAEILDSSPAARA